MKRILRSLCWADPKEKAAASANYKVARNDRLLNLKAADRKVLEMETDFFQHHGEAPQLQTVFNHFDGVKDAEAIVAVEEVTSEQMYEGASFATLFEAEVEEQAAQHLAQVCKTAIKIAVQGEAFGKQTVKGTDQAVAYLFTEVKGKPTAGDDRMPSSLEKSSGQLSALYQKRKANPHQTYGVPTGYGLFDSSTAGIRKKQFYLHAGFGGHLKSTHMLNMVINAAVDGGWNPLIFSSEMPAEDLKLLLVAIHSANPRFNGMGRPISAFRMLLGGLDSVEEKFFEQVKEDLIHGSGHGTIRVVDTSEFTTWGSVMQRTLREHVELEVDILWCDYITRLPLDAKYLTRGMDTVTARNETLADAKRFAMSFNAGEGLAVCSPFQVNREGFKRAKTNAGRLDKTSLAQYNAAEKEADIITYIFYDTEEVATSEPKIGILKSRWGHVNSDPVNVFIDPDSRRIFDLTAGMTSVPSYAPTGQGKRGADEVEL